MTDAEKIALLWFPKSVETRCLEKNPAIREDGRDMYLLASDCQIPSIAFSWALFAKPRCSSTTLPSPNTLRLGIELMP